MSKRGQKEEHKSGAPAWMTTYGDMVTLVLTFFVLLFSFSTIDAKKWEAVVSSFTGNRLVVIEPLDPGAVVQGFDMPTPRPAPSNTEEEKDEFDELYERISNYIEENALTSQLAVDRSEGVILLTINDSALFDSGKDIIKPEAAELLRKVALIFDEYQDNIAQIRIEGHTDNVPIETAQFPSNWELSMGRASKVLQFFLANSIIPPPKYAGLGYGEYHPVASNDNEAGKARNRRVDFVIESIQNIE
ncbi:MAG: OmpA family protein [Clostridiales bacterium]|jgi:chemotaxis protein MotB|nr:OmpA family protein [Clostridiales bacterium]